jgi:DNA-binding MarR family transcriptional regulator
MLGNATFLIHKIGMEVRHRVAEELGRVGLGPRHHRALLCLAAAGPTSQRDLAAATELDPSDVVGVLDDLDQAGFVRRQRDDRDRRRNLVEITPAGRRALGRGDRAAARVEQAILAPLDADDQDRLYALLYRIVVAHELVPADGFREGTDASTLRRA